MTKVAPNKVADDQDLGLGKIEARYQIAERPYSEIFDLIDKMNSAKKGPVVRFESCPSFNAD